MQHTLEIESFGRALNITKSYVTHSTGGGLYQYAVSDDAKNIVEIDTYGSGDGGNGGGEAISESFSVLSGRFGLIIRGNEYDDVKFELLGEGESFDSALNKALGMVENPHTATYSVVVVEGVNKTFAGRTVFESLARFNYITKSGEGSEAEKSNTAINDLPDSKFAYIESGGKKDDEGKTTPRSLRHFPINNKSCVVDAIARINQSSFGKKALPKILAAAKRYGVKVDESKVKENVGKSTILEKSVRIEVTKNAMQKGLVTGVVYAPWDVDTHGDFTSPEEIERAAHNFLPNAVMNVEHVEGSDLEDVTVVESYIAPCDFTLSNGEKVKKGTWVIVSRVNNEELKKAIEEGEVTGYSLEGTCSYEFGVDLSQFIMEQVA